MQGNKARSGGDGSVVGEETVLACGGEQQQDGIPFGPPLYVRVRRASSLLKKSRLGVAEPYVVAKLTRTDPQVAAKPPLCGMRARTRASAGLNPRWDGLLKLNWYNDSLVDEHNGPRYFLLLQVFDRHRLGRDSFLGQAVANLRLLPPGKWRLLDHPASFRVPLQPRSSKSQVAGTVEFDVGYGPSRRDSQGGASTATESFHPATATTTTATATTTTSQQEQEQEHQLGSREAPPERGDNATMSLEDAEELDEVFTATTGSDASQLPLPDGWEKKPDRMGRTMYVNHAERRVTYRHPLHVRGRSRRRSRRTSSTTSGGGVRRFLPSYTTTPPVENGHGPLNQQQQEQEEATTEEGPRVSSEAGALLVGVHAEEAPVFGDVESQEAMAAGENGEGGNGTDAAAEDDDPGVGTQHPVEEPLPSGWVKAKTPDGRVFFIDHNNRTTTWEDPRQNQRRMAVAQDGAHLPVVRRTHGVDGSDVLGPLPAHWEERVTKRGRRFFVNHRLRKTQWEDPRTGLLPSETEGESAGAIFSEAFVDKKRELQKRVEAARPRGKCQISVRRSHVFEDSFQTVSALSAQHLKQDLDITFTGERGLDFGGPSREWFFLLSHEMFNPYYGLFEYSAADNYTLQISPTSSVNPDHLQYFRFIGRVVGLAIFNEKLLDVFFIHPFYKMMLRRPITLADVEVVDADYYRSLQWILDNDPEPLDLTFEVDREEFGVVKQTELRPDGASIPVTQENKEEYVQLVIKNKFVDRVSSQMDAFMKGLTAIVPLEWLEPFTAYELEMLISGISEISVGDWRANTLYIGGYTPRSKVVIWFWQVISSLNMQERARVLQFVTGTSRVPMNGFAELYGSNGPQRFCIARRGNTQQLPRAHTCFNRLDLPPYGSYEEVRDKLLLAVENTEGYDGVD